MSRIGNFTETVGEPNKKKNKRNSFLYLVICFYYYIIRSIDITLNGKRLTNNWVYLGEPKYKWLSRHSYQVCKKKMFF